MSCFLLPHLVKRKKPMQKNRIAVITKKYPSHSQQGKLRRGKQSLFDTAGEVGGLLDCAACPVSRGSPKEGMHWRGTPASPAAPQRPLGAGWDSRRDDQALRS